MKRLTSLLLVLALTLTTLSFGLVTASAEEFTPVEIGASDTTVPVGEDTFTVLRTAEDLTKLATKGNYILAADITANVTLTAPVTEIAAGTVLDGNGYAISGYTTETAGCSIFTMATGSEKITVKNLTVGTEAAPFTATVAGAVSVFGGDTSEAPAAPFLIKDSTFNVNLTLTAAADNGALFGKIAGGNTYAFDGVTVKGSYLQKKNYSNGGWVGYFSNTGATVTFTDCVSDLTATVEGAGQMGGFLGNTKAKVTFDGCENKGNITAGGNAGGFSGYGGGGTVTVMNSVNRGAITSTSGSNRAGGMFGNMGATKINVTDSANYGAVTSYYQAGGILGYAGANVTMTRCVNNGNVELKGGTNNIGGFIGQVYGSVTVNMTDCVNNGDVDAVKDGGGMIGQANFKSGTAIALNFIRCINNGDITEPGTESIAALGGLIGRPAGTVTATGCVNTGTIKGGSDTKRHVGGMLGNTWSVSSVTLTGCSNKGTLEGVVVGGMVASSEKATTIENCANYGTLSASDTAGGIAGVVKGAAQVFTNCKNFGSVSAPAKGGGIIGELAIASTTNGLYNYGSVTVTTNNAGGIIGLASPAITANNWESWGSVSCSAVSGQSNGGMIGYNGGAVTFNDSIFGGTLTSTVDLGGFVGHTKGALTFNNCASVGVLNNINTSSNPNMGALIGKVNADLENPFTVNDVYVACSYAGTKLSLAGVWAGMGDTNKVHLPTLAEGGEALFVPAGEMTSEVGTSVDMDALVVALETAFDGDFVMNDNNTLMRAEPALRGVQNTAPANGEQSIRFVGVVDGLNAYDQLGFRISYTYTANGEEITKDRGELYCEYVYVSILGTEDDGTVKATTAENLGGSYIFAMSLDHVPTNVGKIVFTVTAFAKTLDAEGAVAETFESQTYLVTYNNGIYAGYELATEGGAS